MSYVIAGRAIKSEYLALGTLFSTGLLAYASTSGKKTSTHTGKSAPIVVADASAEEQEFVKQFVAAAEKEDPVKH